MTDAAIDLCKTFILTSDGGTGYPNNTFYSISWERKIPATV